jgi:type IX secretion system PorP/SprF family membrane protein
MGINSGIGFMAMTDRQGDGALTKTGVSAFYSYKLRVSAPIMISFGVQASYYQERVDWDKLVFASQINNTTGEIDGEKPNPPENESVNVVDFAAGAVMTYYDKWFVGVAVHHLTEPKLSFYDNSDAKLPMRFTVHGGMNVNLNDGMLGGEDGSDFILSPQILYMQQKNFRQLNFGLYLSRNPIVLGAWFRHNFQNPDAIIGLIGVNFRNIRLGYSYDFTLSKIGGSSGGAHEISFAWDFCIYKQEKRNRVRAIKSPKF